MGMVELRRDNDGVMVLIDGIESSHLDLDDPTHLVFEYMQQMITVLELTHGERERLSAVHLGGAGCALPRAIDALWRQPRQLAVELDAELAAGVRQWFDLPRAPRLRIRVGEARSELTTMATGSTDVLVRDAFQGRVVPPHLTTTEFTDQVQRVLRADGLYLANLADSPPLPSARREAATVSSVFEHVVVIAEPGVLKGRRYGNILLAASQSPVHRVGLARALRTLPAPAAVIPEDSLTDFIAGAIPLADPLE